MEELEIGTSKMEELEIGTSNMEELKCLVCNKYFCYKRTLKRHSINCSSKESKINKVQCPDSSCHKLFSSKKMLKFHIESDHGVRLQNEQKTFATLHDFKEWKLKTEEDNLCFYAQSARRTVSQNKIITYLDCHRTGYYHSRSTGVRKIKSQGTNKIGSTCPSSMTVVTEDESISVEFCSTHFGHSMDLGRCNLTLEERPTIEDNMSEEVVLLKDLKLVPDKYYNYAQTLRNSKTAIVIDNGSFTCKAGWATSSVPNLIFKNILARPRKERGKKDGETLIGNDIPNIEAVRFQLKSQFDRNVITQFNVQEQIFDYTFSHLGIDSNGGINHPIVLTEPVANPNYSRLLMTELLFECYHVPGICYGIDGLFSYQHNGHNKKTGLVVNCGHHTTHIIPVIKGNPDLINSRRIDVGGYHITYYLHKLLQLKYPAHYNAITPSRAEELLYEHGFLAVHYTDVLKQWSDPDYYDRNVKRIQLPYSMAVVLTPDQQRDKRREMAKKLVEMNARKRDEKLAEDEEQLHQLLLIREMIEDGEPMEEVREVLRSHGLKNEKDLRKLITDLQTRIDRAKSKIAAASHNASNVEEHVTEEPKLRLFKNKIQLPKEESISKTWLNDIYKKRQDIIDKKAVRKQRRQDMAKRGTAASLERMRLISQLARKDKRDDDFGSRDEDWDVYKVINKEGGDTDSEEEQEKISELEEVLRFYDPTFVSSNTNEEQNPKEAHQLHFGIERMRCTEVLFQPSIIGCSQGGIADTIEFILKKYNAQTANDLAKNVFLTGGPTKLPGFKQRVYRELREMRPLESNIYVKLSNSPILDAWSGAKEFANQPDFHKYLLTPEMYAEMGGDYFIENFCSNMYCPLPEAVQEPEGLSEQNTDI